MYIDNYVENCYLSILRIYFHVTLTLSTLDCMSLQYDAFIFRYRDMATLNFHSYLCHEFS